MKNLVGRGVRIILLLLMVFCAPVTGLAAEEKTATNGQGTKSQNPFDISLSSGKGPINISSGKLEFFYNEKRIVYRGDVVVIRDNGTIKSDVLTVTYEELPPNNGIPISPASPASDTSTPAAPATARRQRIKDAVAEGNVKITSANGNATCKKATYDEIKRTVVLSGDAVLRDSENVVKGETVVIYLDENRVTVEGNAATRPEMQLTPKQDEKDKKEAKSK